MKLLDDLIQCFEKNKIDPLLLIDLKIIKRHIESIESENRYLRDNKRETND